jgi:ribonuclease HI
MNKRIEIYTDGACSGNHLKENKGGYGAIIFKPGEETLKISKGYKNTTNNRMELKAVIEALKKVSSSSSVTVYSDSTYVVDGITAWMPKWIKKGKIEKNGDLCMELYRIVKKFDDIEFKHVNGHNGDTYNEEADRLARAACKGFGLLEDIRESYKI